MIGDMSSLSKMQDIRTRSVSPENFTGEKGAGGQATEGTGASCARDLGKGWKVSLSVQIEPGQTFTLADIKGQGMEAHLGDYQQYAKQDSGAENVLGQPGASFR